MKLSKKTEELKNYYTLKSILEYAVWMMHDVEHTAELISPNHLLRMEDIIQKRLKQVGGFIDLAIKQNELTTPRLKNIINFYEVCAMNTLQNFDIETYLSHKNEDIEMTKIMQSVEEQNVLQAAYKKELDKDDPEYMLIVIYEYYSKVLELIKYSAEDIGMYEKEMSVAFDAVYDASEYILQCLEEDKFKDYVYNEFMESGLMDESNSDHLVAIQQNWQNILYEWLFIFETFGNLFKDADRAKFESLFNEGYARLIRNAWEIASHTLEICGYNVYFDFKLLVQHEEVLEYVK